MIDSIGTAAGEIWEYLNSNGPASASKLKKELGLKGPLADRAIGWLARENKIAEEKKGNSIVIVLNSSDE